MELTEKEQRHEQIMSAVAKMCRSDKRGFTETEKLDAIRELLMGSGYHEVLLPETQIWRKDFSTPIDVIVSSHADVVDSITTCSSKLSEDGYYSGTYDNAGTTAASVIAMLEGDIPANVVFAFTADEETGRCKGAKQTLEYVRNLGNDPICIALDVTYEGHDEGYLFTVENLSSGCQKDEDIDFLNDVAQTMMDLETEEKQSCHFVKLSKKSIPPLLDKKYIAETKGWFDEAQAYVYENAKAFSFCLPCEGNMHSNRGVDVRQPAFEGYVNALESFIYSMAKVPNRMQYIATKREENSVLLEKNLEMVAKEEEIANEKRNSNASCSGYCGSRIYSEDDYYDEMAYNESYGIYSGASELSYMQSPNFVDGFISDVIDGSYEYEPNEIVDFYEDAMAYASEEIIEYFGGIKGVTRVVLDIYNNSWSTNYTPSDFMDSDLLEEYEDDFYTDKKDIKDIKDEDDYADDVSGYYDEL